jgi:hypothetical protein
MAVTSYRGKPTRQSNLGELDPRDDDGLSCCLLDGKDLERAGGTGPAPEGQPMLSRRASPRG